MQERFDHWGGFVVGTEIVEILIIEIFVVQILCGVRLCLC